MSRPYIFIQARTGSTRFPGKVLQPFGPPGESLIGHIFQRCRLACDDVVVLIPTGDNRLADHLNDRHIPYFEGHPTDVLQRYYDAAMTYNADPILRITGDCPLFEVPVLEHMMASMKNRLVAFATTLYPPRRSYDGNDIEVMTWATLALLNSYAVTPYDREHVTPYLYRSAFDRRVVTTYTYAPIIDQSAIKLSVDTPEDLARCQKQWEEWQANMTGGPSRV